MEHRGQTSGFLFVLIVLASLPCDEAAEKRKLDIAPDAVDDTFSHCFAKMSTVVTEPGGLLRKELDASSSFSQTWRRGDEPVCEKQIPGGNKHHTTALQAYGNADNNFRKLFNDLVYSKGSNTTTYVDGFPFKSLHFLLMDAFRLANGRMSCTTLFYGTKNQYAAKPDAEVRFGKFIRAEEKHSDVTERVIDGGTVFNITSCSIVKMDDYTCRSEDTNYLISPNEAFRVKGVRNVDNDDETYTEITLTHTRIISNHDCYLFPSGDAGSSSVLLSFSVRTLVTSVLVYSTLLE